MDDETWIVPGDRRALMVPRGKDRRVTFTKGRQQAFLEHLAATCNVVAAAAAAGVSPSGAYRRRMRDEGFRAGWDEAIQQGYARLEAALLERAARGSGRPRVRGDLEVEGADAPAEVDWDKAMDLLRHHQRDSARAKPYRPMQRVPVEDLATVLVKRLKALGVRPDEAALRALDTPGAAAENGR